MYSNYKQMYQQNNGTNAYISNSKFLKPSSIVYIQQCPNTNNCNEKIPLHFKYTPENLKVNPGIQVNSFRENYKPPTCQWCTKGGIQIPGAGLYGMEGSPIIGKEINTNPSTCNYENNQIKERFCNQNDNKGNKMVFSRNMISFAPPNKWGPKAWDFFHSVSFSYPENPTSDQKQSALDFFNGLPFMLPCSSCGQHCAKHLKQFPPQVENRDTLTKWLYNFHNIVNQSLNKDMPSFNEIKKMYQ